MVTLDRTIVGSHDLCENLRTYDQSPISFLPLRSHVYDRIDTSRTTSCATGGAIT